MVLNPRQQKFIDAYLACGNAAEAYRRAGYTCKNSQVAAAGGERLLRNAEIHAAIEAGHAALREEDRVSKGDILKGLLTEARRIENGSPQARVASWKLLAELLGLLGDAQVKQMLAELMGRLDGFEAAKNAGGSKPEGGGTGAPHPV